MLQSSCFKVSHELGTSACKSEVKWRAQKPLELHVKPLVDLTCLTVWLKALHGPCTVVLFDGVAALSDFACVRVSLQENKCYGLNSWPFNSSQCRLGTLKPYFHYLKGPGNRCTI